MKEATEELHRLFRAGIREAKGWRVVELLASVGTLAGAFRAVTEVQNAQFGPYAPLVTVLLAIVAFWARRHVAIARGSAERCRRLSIRAFALGEELPAKAASDAIDDAPWIAKSLASRYSREGIASYYGASLPVGPPRILEFYAESAYFTRRLLLSYSGILMVAVVSLIAIALVGLYSAAVNSGADTVRLGEISNELLSGVIAGLVLGLAQELSDASSAARSVREIEDALLSLDLIHPNEQELRSLTRDYDSEHVTAPLIPSWLYALKRSGLNADWESRKRMILGATAAKPPDNS